MNDSAAEETRDEIELMISPPCSQWTDLIKREPKGEISNVSLPEWRTRTRRELGLATDRPVIATGHQALLWHPGILAKYMMTDAFARAHDLATANLIVDQHTGGFGEFEAPVRREDGSLAVRSLPLCRPAPRREVPMGRHAAFTPPRPPVNFNGAIESVNQGVRRIFDAAYANREAPSAALQIAAVISEFMKRWVGPMPGVPATNLMATSLARTLMQCMIDDPHRCAQCYNRAVAAVPESGIGPLLIRDDYVELPLWRIREDGRRMRSYDNDVELAIGKSQSSVVNRESSIDLLPRALFMTALVRLGMCDLFIHGTGGANYDRAMELWIMQWLGVEVGAIAVVTANMRLPLISDQIAAIDASSAVAAYRRGWHNPQATQRESGGIKQELLRAIDAAPRNSPQRKTAFLRMHERLAQMRDGAAATLQEKKVIVERAKRRDADGVIARRRDWAFPLYPDEMLDALAHAATRQVNQAKGKSSVRR